MTSSEVSSVSSRFGGVMDFSGNATGRSLFLGLDFASKGWVCAFSMELAMFVPVKFSYWVSS